MAVMRMRPQRCLVAGLAGIAALLGGPVSDPALAYTFSPGAALQAAAPDGGDGLVLQMTGQGLSAADGAVTVSSDGVGFVPIDASAIGAAWRVSVDAETRWTLAPTRLNLDENGRVVALDRRFDAGGTGDLADGLLILPDGVDVLMLQSAGPITVRFEPAGDLPPLGTNEPPWDRDGWVPVPPGRTDWPLTPGDGAAGVGLQVDLPFGWSGRLDVTEGETGAQVRLPLDGGVSAVLPPLDPDLSDAIATLWLDPPPDAAADRPVPVRVRRIAAPPIDDEREPNDRPEVATPLSWPDDARRGRVAGRWLAEGDTDVWSLTVTGARADTPLRLEVEPQAPGATYDLELSDLSGEVLLDYRLQGEADIRNLILPAGPHRLSLTGRGVPSDYTVTVRGMRRADTDAEREPNGTAARADALSPDRSRSGHLFPGDVDVYRFEITEPGRLWRVFASGGPRIALRRADGVVVTRADGAGDVAQTADTGLPVGTYFASLSGAGDYTLRLIPLGPRPTDFEREPNDDPSQGDFLSVGDHLHGQIGASSDADTVRFSLTGSRWLTLTVTAPDDGDLAFQRLWYGSTQQETRLQPGETASLTAEFPPGDHRLRLFARATAGRSLWRVALAAAAPPTLGQETDLEPNDDFASATPVPASGRIRGTVGAGGGWDYHVAETPAGPGAAALTCADFVGEWEIGHQPAGMDGDPPTRFRGGLRALNAHPIEVDRPGRLFVLNRPWLEDAGYDCRLGWFDATTALPDDASRLIQPAFAAQRDGLTGATGDTRVTGWLSAEEERDEWLIQPPEGAREAWLSCAPGAGYRPEMIRHAEPMRPITRIGDSVSIYEVPDAAPLRLHIAGHRGDAPAPYACTVRFTAFGAGGTAGGPAPQAIDLTGSPAARHDLTAQSPAAARIRYGRPADGDVVELVLAPPAGASAVLLRCQGGGDRWWPSNPDRLSGPEAPFAPGTWIYAVDPTVPLTLRHDIRDHAGPFDCLAEFLTAPAETVLAEAGPEPSPVRLPAQVTRSASVEGRLLGWRDRDTIDLTGPAGGAYAVRCEPAEAGPGTELAFAFYGTSFNAPDRADAHGTLPAGWLYAPFNADGLGRVQISRRDRQAATLRYRCDLLYAQDFTTLSGSVQADPLPATLAVVDPAPLVAFSRFAQRQALALTVTNPRGTAIELDLEAALPGAGWRVDGLPPRLTLPAGETATVAFDIIAAADLVPADRPELTIRGSGAAGAAVTATLAFEVETGRTPVGAEPFWATPAAVLGGLNLADARLGAEVIAVEGATGAVEDAGSAVDGLAALGQGTWIGDALTVRLAGSGPAMLAGAAVSLRTIDDFSERWPGHAVVEVSVDGATFTPAWDGALRPIRDRQVLVFEAPQPATHLRLRATGCAAARCAVVTEVMAIADPERPSPLDQPINLADPALGGGIVSYDHAHFGADSGSHILDSARSLGVHARADEEPLASWIVGFWRGRAAQIAAIEWQETEEHGEAPPPTLTVYGRADLPFAPFERLGEIASPPPGGTSRLDFDTPPWVRFLRLELPDRAPHAAPDLIRVLERPAGPDYRSILGVWDEDDLRGPLEHEAASALAALEATAVAGGATADLAVPLQPDAPVWSRVRKEDNQDWFTVVGPNTGALLVELHHPISVEVGARLYAPDGTEIALVPAAEADPALAERVAETRRRTGGDAVAYVAAVMPGETYRLRVAEEARLIVLRREFTDLLAHHDEDLLRGFEIWAHQFGDGADALQLGLETGDETLLRGEDAILLALNRVAGDRETDGVGTTDFSEALAAAGDLTRHWPGGRAIVYAGMGGGLMQAEDMDFVYALEGLSARLTAVFLHCRGFFCPDPAAAERNVFFAAAAGRGRFLRHSDQRDVRDAMALIAAGLTAPKTYRVTVAAVSLPDPAPGTEPDAPEDAPDAQPDVSPEPASTAVAPEAGDADEPEPPAQATLTVLIGDPEGAADDEQAATIVPGATAVVLDASGSMLQWLDGRRRIDIAHDTLSHLVETVIPPGSPFLFRAFGLAPESCQTRAVLPLGPLDPQAAAAAIRAVPAINLARTAIAESLRATADDLADYGGERTIVLVTDGEETCGGGVAGTIERLNARGFQIRLNIVGFAIDDPELRATFADWAALGNGVYVDAQNAEELTDALERVVVPTVRIELLAPAPDALSAPGVAPVWIEAGARVVEVGTDVRLPPGDYAIRLEPPFEAVATVRIDPGEDRTVLLGARP